MCSGPGSHHKGHHDKSHFLCLPKRWCHLLNRFHRIILALSTFAIHHTYPQRKFLFTWWEGLYRPAGVPAGILFICLFFCYNGEISLLPKNKASTYILDSILSYHLGVLLNLPPLFLLHFRFLSFCFFLTEPVSLVFKYYLVLPYYNL